MNVNEVEETSTSDFELEIKFEEEINAFVIYWNVEFTHGKESITLETSPYDPPTHWRVVLGLL